MTLVLVVHHDADLYGADQSLLRAARALKRSAFTPVVVVPHHGPLVPLLLAEGVEVHIGPVGKLSRQRMQPTALPGLLADLVRSVRFMSRVVAGRRMALVYTNSVAALGGALWALLNGVPRLWHVREIVVAPRLAVSGFPWLLGLLGGWCVCNSKATRQWLVEQRPALGPLSSVVWNGIEALSPPPPEAVQAFRSKLGLAPADTVVTLVGRINRWKGQGVLIDAAARLQQQGHTQLRYLIVGDVAEEQHHFREAMLARIAEAGLADTVLWHPFTSDVDVVWAATDIAVAPSIEPEPFGRVAIEAMSHGLPVVAADHGGLAEIVVNRHTGLLVPPGDDAALADAIAQLAGSAERRRALGAAGRQRQGEHFTQAEHDRKLLALISDLAHGVPPHDQATIPA